MTAKEFYKNARPEAHPFSIEGLTVAEIEAFYKDAAKKNECIGILADCCDTDEQSIAEFLEARGLIAGTSAAKTRRQQENKDERLEQYIQLSEKGLTMQEAADQLGCTLATVRSYAYRNKISFRQKKKNKQKTQKETMAKQHTIKQNKAESKVEDMLEWVTGAVKQLRKDGVEVLKVQAESVAVAIKYRKKERTFILRLSEESDQ